MARIRRIFRTRLWLYSLLCVLSVVARSEAATRVPVKMPTSAVATSAKGVATKGNGVVKVEVSEGEYIPGATIDKRVPVKVLKRIDYSIPRTINAAKSLLKANLAQALLGAAITGAVAAVGWVMSPDNTELQKPTYDVDNSLSLFWCGESQSQYCYGSSATSKRYANPELAKAALDSFYCSQYGSMCAPGSVVSTVVVNGSSASYKWSFPVVGANYSLNGGTPLYRHGSCSEGFVYISTTGVCQSSAPSSFASLTESDYSALDPYVNSQTADWIKSLVRDGCAGAINVEACTQDLQDFHNVTGPASVTGPTITTTGTYTRPDGTTGTTSSVTTTNYSLLYGDNYFDYSKSTTVTNTKDGVTTDQSTTTEDPGATEDTPPEDEKDDEAASPCTANCDGPAYVDMYNKTDKTKEGELDSYKSKIQGVPIIAAVSGLFNVSVSAACPVWSYSGTLELVGASMPIDLVFDFQCQPWFTDLRPYAQAIMLIVCGLLAVRIGLL